MATSVVRTRLAATASVLALTIAAPALAQTALDGGAPWHVRVHRVSTDRELVLSETGFALPWEPEGFAPPGPDEPEHGRAVVTSPWGGSTVVDLRDNDRHARDAAVSALSPNANIMWPHTIVPALATLRLAGRARLLVAYGVGAVGYALGLGLSALFDLPSGPTIVWALAAVALLLFN